MVKTSEEDDPIAVMTVLSTRQHAGQECMKEIRAFLVSKCDGADSKAKVAAAWDAKDTALLLNERLINCPPKIAPPLMQARGLPCAIALLCFYRLNLHVSMHGCTANRMNRSSPCRSTFQCDACMRQYGPYA